MGALDILTSEKALIFRITHVRNVPWILREGLHSRNSPVVDKDFIQIGKADLIGKRATRTIGTPPGGTLSDYVAFYFTPCSPMLLNIRTGYNGVNKFPSDEIAILVSSLNKVVQHGAQFLITDRHAYLETASFFNTREGLAHVDWALLRKRDFSRNPKDPGKFERYQAEALVHEHLPTEALSAIACRSHGVEKDLKRMVEDASLGLKVVLRPAWYFE